MVTLNLVMVTLFPMVAYALLAVALKRLLDRGIVGSTARFAFWLFAIAAVGEVILFSIAAVLTPGQFTGWLAILWTIIEPVVRMAPVIAALLVLLSTRKQPA